MFQRIIKFSIENKLVVGVFTCALVACGGVGPMVLASSAFRCHTRHHQQSGADYRDVSIYRC